MGVGADDYIDKMLVQKYQEEKVDNHENENVEAENKVENESASVKDNMEQKMSYIENIDIGTITSRPSVR